MPGPEYIPINAVHEQLADIDRRLSVLQKESERIREQMVQLQGQKAILESLSEQAVRATDGKSNHNHSPGRTESIPNGRVATPIIFAMLKAKPGITSVELIDALAPRVTKRGPKGPRKFLADLLWELGHRKKIRRDAAGHLFLLEDGGEP